MRSLADLRRAVLTNGPPDIQRLKGHAQRAPRLVRRRTDLRRDRAREPDPSGFLGCRQTLGVEPADAEMVGDSWARDIEGGLLVGMRAVWVSASRSVPPEPAPVHAVESVSAIALMPVR